MVVDDPMRGEVVAVPYLIGRRRALRDDAGTLSSLLQLGR